MSDDTFAGYGLPEPLQRAIADLGFERCTPVQSEVLPYSLSDYDITGQAQTGTGKTAAFLITMLTRHEENPLERPNPPGTPRALILAPTRELALQIEADAIDLSRYLDTTIVAVFGGLDFNRQIDRLRDAEVDILVATPRTPARLLRTRRGEPAAGRDAGDRRGGSHDGYRLHSRRSPDRLPDPAQA